MKRGIWGNSLALLATCLLALFLAFTGGASDGEASHVAFVVNSTMDVSDSSVGDGVCDTGGGICTLRAAIQEANAHAGADAIEFSLGPGTPSIGVGSTGLGDLPDISETLDIDGNTGGSTRIELNGSAAGLGGIGLFFTDTADGSRMNALVVNRFNNGVAIVADGTVVTNSRIGTDSTGAVDLGNRTAGIEIAGGSNVIGGTTAGEGNVISGNDFPGLSIAGSTADGNQITGNHIGVNAAGNAALGNGSGIKISSRADQNVIGGPTLGSRNIISGNSGPGIFLERISMQSPTGNSVLGNYIGTDVTGAVDLGNLAEGVFIGGGVSTCIGGLFQSPICDPLAGGTNVISGNDGEGVRVGGPTNKVVANIIGLNAGGTSALGNAGSGVKVESVNNTIGGTTPQARNIISGNAQNGVLVTGFASLNSVMGNYVGLNVAGSGAVPNLADGVRLEGTQGPACIGAMISGSACAPAAGGGNVISGNVSDGIELADSATVNLIVGNRIGTNAAGTAAMPNGSGINVNGGSGYNTIGGLNPYEPNTVAFNTGAAVILNGGETSVRGNSIYSNGSGIVNPGAPSAPVIDSVVGGVVSGSACSFCEVDIYNDSGGQGRIYRGTTTADAAGSFSVGGIASTLANITATTGYDLISLNTSTFSAAFPVAGNADADGAPDSSDGCPFDPEDYDQFEDGDACPDVDNDLDGICDPGQVSVSCTGLDFGRYLWQNPLPSQQDCRNVAEDIDSFHDTDGCPEPDNDYDTFPDHADDCPATDANVGADGVADTGDEPVLYLTPYQAREDFDGVIDTDGCHDSPDDDYDGDGLGDETEVFIALTDPIDPDSDADSVTDGPDNCRLWPNPSQTVPAWALLVNDSDCDGFTNSRETYLTTNPTQHCAASSTANNESPPDFWPLDMNDNRQINTVDVGFFVGKIGLDSNEAGWTSRLDLNQSANGIINTVDVGFYVGRLGNVCSPTGP